MKVNSQSNISFRSIYTNKALKKGLEFAADNGALFKASAVVGFSLLRPFAIMNTPNTDRENRKLASVKSVTSSLIGFLLMLGVSTPVSKSINKINKNPEKFLKPVSMELLKDSDKKLINSKGYIFATQLFKLGVDTLFAIPKAILVAFGMPYIMNLISNKNENVSLEQSSKTPTFKAKPENKIAKTIGDTINKNTFLNFVNRFKDTNFPLHIMALADTLATSTFIFKTKKTKKIEEGRKKALIYNSAISTGLSIVGGYVLDRMLNKPTERFIEKFKKANFGEKNLEKQIQGIKIAKPVLILGTIYYIIIPLISTYLAERAGKNVNKEIKI